MFCFELWCPMLTTRKAAKLFSIWETVGRIYVFLLGSYSLLLFNANMTCSAITLVCTWLWLILTHAVMVPFLHISNWSYWSLGISYFKSQRKGIWLTHAISSFLHSRLCQMLLAGLWFGCQVLTQYRSWGWLGYFMIPRLPRSVPQLAVLSEAISFTRVFQCTDRDYLFGFKAIM